MELGAPFSACTLLLRCFEFFSLSLTVKQCRLSLRPPRTYTLAIEVESPRFRCRIIFAMRENVMGMQKTDVQSATGAREEKGRRKKGGEGWEGCYWLLGCELFRFVAAVAAPPPHPLHIVRCPGTCFFRR